MSLWADIYRKPDSASMIDRLDAADERAEKRQRRTMMERLNERDEERERIARAAQATLEPNVQDHNALHSAPTPAPANQPEARETEDPGVDYMADLVDEVQGLRNLEGRVETLEGYHP